MKGLKNFGLVVAGILLRRYARRPSPSMVVALFALLLASGGVAYAAIPDSGGEIHGCYVNRTGALRVIDTEATPPETCTTKETALTWNGSDGAELAISPTAYNFGSVASGSQSAATTFTVTNIGGATSGVLTYNINGEWNSQFSRSGGTCVFNTTTLAAGVSCTVSVTFAPSSTGTAGTKNASLNVSATPGGLASAALSGTVPPAQLAISPTAYNFGSVALDSQSAATTFTVTNIGGATSGVLTYNISGEWNSEFSRSGGTCVFNTTTLAAGVSCTVSVTFAPTTSAGTKNASLNVSATPGGLASAALLGTVT